MPIDINNLIKKDTADLIQWVEFKQGIKLKLRYVSRQKLLQISKASEELKWQGPRKGRMPEMNSDKFTKLFVEAAVLDWEGVTPLSIGSIVPTDLSEVPSAEIDKAIPFSHEALSTLAKNAYELDNFIQEASMDLSTFKSDYEDELGNSEPSQSGN